MTGPGPGQRGFTILEMLLVVVLMGIMGVMTSMAMTPMLENIRFRRQVERYAAMMRQARALAISSGQTTRLELGGEGTDCVFTLYGPKEEKKGCDLEERDVLVMNPGLVAFFPEGTATAGLLTFSRGERKARIQLDLLTGRPELE